MAVSDVISVILSVSVVSFWLISVMSSSGLYMARESSHSGACGYIHGSGFGEFLHR